jgi:16S rRNA (guanine966-N2)-methyltransferase
VRPTTDRVREAVFNALGSLGAVEGKRVLDLFAGSGALGIEALSRGAEDVTFVDADAEAVALVRRNLAALGLEDRARVVQADAADFLARDAHPVDLALLDPPYAQPVDADLLRQLDASVAVVESSSPPEVPEDWATLRQRRYSSTLVTIIRRLSAPE